MRNHKPVIYVLLLVCVIIVFVIAQNPQVTEKLQEQIYLLGGGEAVFLPGETVGAKQQAQGSRIIAPENGDTVDLSASVITKEIDGKQVKLYGYNNQFPGPLLKVNKGDTITVNFKNRIDMDTTIHWHGLRHDNKDDGVPDVTQEEIPPGEFYKYKVSFPDAGMFWYHSHSREDVQQEAGLAGTILVYPNGSLNSINRAEVLVLDDMLIGDELAPFGKEHANFALMGRFGNVLLVNGREEYSFTVENGSVVRYYLVNVANTRIFNISFGGAKMKLVGGDMGKYERETFVDSIVIAPGERYVVDVLFDSPGEYELQHINPFKTYNLGRIYVRGEPLGSGDLELLLARREIDMTDYRTEFEHLTINEDAIEDIHAFKDDFEKEPDYTIMLTVDMPRLHQTHREGKIEWEDTMKMMNARSTTKEIRWVMRDIHSRRENMDIVMKAKVGDKLKIRIINELNSMHPMQHPIHLHGQRFLVLSVDDEPNTNLVWKDTVLVPKGKTVDILVDVTNPGKWMFHCQTTEHLEAGMKTMLVVEEIPKNLKV